MYQARLSWLLDLISERSVCTTQTGQGTGKW
jgi:hypothetical protein